MAVEIEKFKTMRLGELLSGDHRLYEIRGNKDGKVGLPRDRLTITDDLVTQGATALSAYQSDLEKEKINIEGRLSTAQKAQEEAMANQDQTRAKKARELDDLNRAHENKIRGLDNRYREVERQYQNVCAEVQGRPLRAGHPYIYFAIMCFIALVEWPINRLAFEAAFQEALAIASMIALAVGIALAFIAHSVGAIARRMEYVKNSRRKLFRHIFPLVGLLIFTFFVIYVIALARHEFVKLISEQNVSAVALFQQQGKLATAVSEGFFAPQFGPSDWGLLVINLLVFLVASSISFASHDPHPDYAKTYRQRNRLMRRLERMRGKFAQKFAEVGREYDDRIGAAQHRAVRLSDEIAECEKDLQMIEHATAESVRMVATAIAGRVNTYINANRTARNSGTLPEFLTESPDPLEIFSQLRTRMALT